MVILRTYYEIDASSAVHDLCAFGLRDASGNGNNHSGTALCFRHLETSHQAKLRIHLFRCLFSDMTSIEDYQIRILWPFRLRKAEWRQKICHTHRIVDIHLAAIGLDIDTPRDAVFRACDRASCHRACATRPQATRRGGHGAAVPASAAAAQTVLRQVRQRCGHSNSSQGPFANHSRKEMLAGGILPPLRPSRGRSGASYLELDRPRAGRCGGRILPSNISFGLWFAKGPCELLLCPHRWRTCRSTVWAAAADAGTAAPCPPRRVACGRV